MDRQADHRFNHAPPLPQSHRRPPQLQPLDTNCLPAERAAGEAFVRFKGSTLKRLTAEASSSFIGGASKAEIVSGGILAMPCVEV